MTIKELKKAVGHKWTRKDFDGISINTPFGLFMGDTEKKALENAYDYMVENNANKYGKIYN